MFGIGAVVMSFVVSILFSLTFETPLIRAFKMVLEGHKEKPDEIKKTAIFKID